MRRTCAAALLSLALVGCSAHQYHCVASSQCQLGGTTGRCEPSGFCSFPDAACATAQRYGALSPDELADQCVAPTPSLCSALDAPLCDGFEAALFDPQWMQFTRNGALALDTSHVYRGAHAVKMSIATSASEPLQAELVEQRTFPATDFFMREFVFLPSMTPPAEMQLMIAYQTVDPLQGVVLSVVPRPGGFAPTELNEISGTSVHVTSAQPPFAADRWTCLEWEVQIGDPGKVRVWIDDVEYTDLAIAQRTTPSTPIAQIAFGDTQDPGAPAHELWIDEVAVGDARIGCSR